MERLLTIKHFVHFHHGSGFGVTYLPRFFSLSIVAKCLAHARRQFIELEVAFPRACARVLDALAEVYRHDAEAKQMTVAQRLTYHQLGCGSFRTTLQSHLTSRRCVPLPAVGADCGAGTFPSA